MAIKDLVEQQFQEILDAVETKEGKIEFLKKAMKASILKAGPILVSIYEEAGRFEEAGKLAKQLNDHDRSLSLYRQRYAQLIKENDHEEAGRIAYYLGLNEEAILHYEKGGKFQKAAQIAEGMNQINRAIDLFEKAGWYDDAARLAEESGQKEKSIHLFKRQIDDLEKEGMIDEACKLAEKLGMINRSIEIHQKGEQHGQSGRLFEMLEKYQEAMASYEKAGLFEEARRLAEKLNKIPQKQYYELLSQL
jgi:tetratricopeptide (TPR) repeat protein